MIRRPGHLADHTPPVGTPVPVEGLDLALAGRNVAAAGGSAERFAVSFAAGRAAAEGIDPVALAGIAGWRAGALGLRDDALRSIDSVRSTGAGVAAAAALGMDAADLGAFVDRQRADRYWWPGRREANGYVCAVGGFRGLGGAWTAPPADGRPLDADGAFAVRTGERWWRIDADVWGSRLSPLDDEPEPGAAGAASVLTFADSYLAWIHVAAPA
ncbi:potassium transporter Kef [Microbacterium testaceum]|uniref:potassium transporter Kef n=1 Tax=Microbacterium testaceum TaxID=2033 RepID=UPI0012ACC3BD|nr:potassium transporter Kef [Microbacterium testaceum]